MYKKTLLLKFILIIFSSLFCPLHAEKIRDLTNVQGVRDNQLIGYGLVVGLDGTGDQSIQTPFTHQSLKNMLSKFGLNIPPDLRMNLKNVASVIVTATLPAFSHAGDQIDVMVSSMGNAKSLRGGTLLMTSLKGLDNQIYAIAQGNILVSEKNNSKNRINYMSVNQVNSGRINHGAIIEREIYTDFGKKNTINLKLNEENFSVAQRISDMINMKYPDTANPIDSKTIQLNTTANNNVQVHMLANIQDIDIPMPKQQAKVIINPRTGDVVINEEVKIGTCIISNGNISLLVHPRHNLHNHINSSNKKNDKNNKNQIYQEKFYNLNKDNLHEMLQSLKLLGSKTHEIVTILQLMKNAGCLHAKLEII